MKDKIIIFLVGLLLGSIISTGSIYFYTVANSKNNNENMQMPNDREKGDKISNESNTPPEIPGNEKENK